MSKKANPAIIGAFVLGAVLLTVASVLIFGSGILKQKDEAILIFDGSLGGLRVGANVNFRGVRIGEVTDITLYANPETLEFFSPVVIEINPERIHVFSKTTQDFEERDADDEDWLPQLIAKGMRAQLQVQSIVTGQLEISLDFHPDSPALMRSPFKEPGEIPTVPSAAQQLSEAFHKIMAGLKDVPLDEIFKHVESAVEGIEELVRSPHVANTLAGLDKLVNSEDTQQLTASLRGAADDFDAAIKDLRGIMQRTDKRMDPVLKNVADAAAEMRDTLAEAERTLAGLSADLSANSELRYRINASMRELEGAARSIRVLAEFLERHPEALLRGKPSQ